MQDAVARAERQAHVCGRTKSTAVTRNNPDDVTTAEFRFNPSDLVFRNFVKRPRGNVCLHASKRSQQRSVRREIPIMSPAGAHLPRRMCNTASTQITSHILYESTPIVIVQPILQVMQPRKIIAGAFAAPVSIHLD